MVEDTKVAFLDSTSSIVDSGTVGVDGMFEGTVLEATVTGKTETVVETDWTYSTISYDKQIVSGAFSVENVTTIDGLAKNVSFSQIINQVDDALITESDKATVDAYTELDTAQQLYDRAKSYLVDNFLGETSTIISRNNSTIEAGSYNVVIDGTAGSAFAFDGSTITIKSTTFVGGINTSGTVTVRNGALLGGGQF
jgi:hypothetical protein